MVTPRKAFPERLFLSSSSPPSGTFGAAALPWWHPAALIATVGGVGHLRPAPGTWGSLAALPPAWLLTTMMGTSGLAAATLIVSVVGIWASAVYVRRTGLQDPSVIVVDEVAGQWLTLLAVPVDPLAYGLGFVLFRIFDVLKPWPVSWADRRVKGGLGVVLDDLLAGLLAGAIAWLLWNVLTAWGVSGHVS